jgi:hypothetical protein
MTDDRRDRILLQLVALMAQLAAANGWHQFRNRGSVPNELRPAVVVLDGTEDGGAQLVGRRRPGNSPTLMVMKPQIFFLAKKTETVQNTDMGPTLNVARGKIIKAIATDPSLASLCGEGEILYRGMISDMQTGAPMEGEMQLNFSMGYMFNPNSL